MKIGASLEVLVIVSLQPDVPVTSTKIAATSVVQALEGWKVLSELTLVRSKLGANFHPELLRLLTPLSREGFRAG